MLVWLDGKKGERGQKEGCSEKLHWPSMALFGTRHLGVDGWYHHVRTAETNSAVVVARRKTAAARSYGTAKLTANDKDDVYIYIQFWFFSFYFSS